MADVDKVKIKSIYNAGEANAELLVKIKSDYISDCSSFDVNVFADLNKPSKTTVVATQGENSYVGTNERTLCQNFLIIVNKNKKRARLLPIKVCDLSQVNNKNDSKNLPDLDYHNKRSILTDKFGSKKSKRKLELTNKMRVNAEACEMQVKPIVESTEIDQTYLEELCDGSESLEKLFPPRNSFASTPQGVYSLDSLLTEIERESLKEAAEYYIENPPVEDDESVSKFLFIHYNLISKNINVDCLIILLYAECLIKLLKIHAKELRNREAWNTISPYSKVVISKLKREFTDSKIVTMQMKHKIACHALVATMLACGYKIYFDKISPFFPGIHTHKLQQLCSLVGAVPMSRGSRDVLTLKVPLPPLPVARSPKKKRR